MHLWYKTLEAQMDHLARDVASAEKRCSDRARQRGGAASVGAITAAAERITISAARGSGRVGLRRD